MARHRLSIVHCKNYIQLLLHRGVYFSQRCQMVMLMISFDCTCVTLTLKTTNDFSFSYAPEKIPGLIETNDADLRNQAGETIAVLYEIAREINSVFADPPESLLITLDKKANESAKYRGKKEKRLQRATFREIYNSFEVNRND